MRAPEEQGEGFSMFSLIVHTAAIIDSLSRIEDAVWQAPGPDGGDEERIRSSVDRAAKIVRAASAQMDHFRIP